MTLCVLGLTVPPAVGLSTERVTTALFFLLVSRAGRGVRRRVVAGSTDV